MADFFDLLFTIEIWPTASDLRKMSERTWQAFIPQLFQPEHFTCEVTYPVGSYEKGRVDLFIKNPENILAPNGHIYVELKL